jgi:hypothetical protein
MTDNTNSQVNTHNTSVQKAIDALFIAWEEDGLTYYDLKALLELQDELKYRKLDQHMEYCR